MFKIISICFLSGVAVAFAWAVAALIVETIKERKNGYMEE